MISENFGLINQQKYDFKFIETLPETVESKKYGTDIEVVKNEAGENSVIAFRASFIHGNTAKGKIMFFF